MKCIYLNMYKNNVGMIGLGSWGKNIYRNLETLNVLKKIYDSNTEHLNNTVTSKKKIANNADEIILSKDIDNIFVASPADTHKNYIIKSLLNNKNVFVEKPLCLSLKDAMEIKNLSSEVNKIVFVGHLLHYHNGFNELKNIIKLGKIGNLKIIKANRLNFGAVRQKESVLFDLASHDISMILSLTQKNPIRVQTESLPILQDNIADIATIHLDFEDNLKSRISVSWLHPFKEHKLIVIGTKGMATFDDTKDWEKKLFVNEYNIDLNPEKLSGQKSEGKFIKVDYAEPLKEECKYFIDLIDNKVMPLTDGAEGLKVLSVLTETG